PRHITAHLNGQRIAAAPAYAKSHSQGEYVFDHSWADAYMRAGGQYYPKLQLTVPFTPVTGPRFLTRAGFETVGQSALMQGALQLAAENKLSSMHITFCTKFEAEIGKAIGLMHRIGQQFHWINSDYKTFDDFLTSLSSRKRKNIRREFFDIAHQILRHDMLLVMAERDGQWVAGALNFIGADTLFGRYWGCIEDHPALHFELCYYRAIDYAIEHGLARVEAGAQGEHKLARGYLPVTTHSLHWIADESFRTAVSQFLDEERDAVDQNIEVMTSYGPFKRG
ncbi:hypothetical protein JI58_10075, partial [Marinosulfonomonas sp. PRT-SC04]